MGTYNNKYAGFETVNGGTTYQNRTRVDLSLEKDVPHVAVIEVYNDRVRASVDGRVIRDWPTTYKEFGPTATRQYQPRDPTRLALGVWNTPANFQKVEVVEVTGVGRQLR